MWVRQCDLDAQADAPSPIPTRIASNEEFIPPPQSPRAEGVRGPADRHQRAGRQAPGARPPRLPPHRQRHGRGAAGPQPGLRRLLRRRRRRGRRPEGLRGEVAQGPVHLRRADAPRRRQPQVVRRHAGRPGAPSASSACCGRSPADLEKSLELLNRAHYVKEVFGDSDTVMAVISGVPTPRLGQEPAAARPDGRDAQVRQRPGRLAARAVARPAAAQPRQAGARGDGAAGQGAEDRRLEDVHRRRARREGLVPGRREGRLPVLGADARSSASRTSASTRACRSASFNEKACTPLDLEKAAKDWPDLNFIVYHSGYPRHRLRSAAAPATRSTTRRPTTRRRSPGSATSSAS